jgi:hypothetical protein
VWQENHDARKTTFWYYLARGALSVFVLVGGGGGSTTSQKATKVRCHWGAIFGPWFDWRSRVHSEGEMEGEPREAHTAHQVRSLKRQDLGECRGELDADFTCFNRQDAGRRGLGSL